MKCKFGENMKLQKREKPLKFNIICIRIWPRPYTGCGRNNSHILKVYKNQMKQGTQKILLFIKSTYDAFFSKHF